MVEYTNSSHLEKLPIPLSTFIGREKEILQVKRLISEHRLVTLTGAGGSGKTRLAMKVAHELLENFESNVRFIGLASLGDPSLVTLEIASILNIRDQSSRPLLDSLINHLSTHPFLLILDNCEHLIEACAEIADTLLQKCPNLKILATSREVLRITGEVSWVVPPLSLPEVQAWKSPTGAQEALGEYQKSESVQLFIARESANSSGFKLTTKNGAWVAEICRRLDGMPLAIELAAARVRTLSVRQIAERLDDRFTLLTSGSRTAPERHQTLIATLDWSYDLLIEREQKVLQRLSVFAGGATLDTAVTVCRGDEVRSDNVLEILTSLVDKSMVIVDRFENRKIRYRLLETIREYASEKLVDSNEVEQVKDRHLDFFLKHAEDLEPKIRTSNDVIGYDQLEDDLDNMRAALNWAIESQKIEAGIRLACGLNFFWFFRGFLKEGLVWWETLLAQRQGVSDASIADALKYMCGLLIWSDDYDYNQTVLLLNESLNLYRELGDKAGIAWVLNYLGVLEIDREEYEEAERLLRESLELRREIGDPWSIAHTLQNFVGIAISQNDNKKARKITEETINLFRQAENQHSAARMLSSLGLIARKEGDTNHAETLLRQSLSKLIHFKDPWSIAYALENIGILTNAGGDQKRAVQILGAVDSIRETIGMPPPNKIESNEVAQQLSVIRAGLRDEEFNHAWAMGRAMTLKQAVELALHEPDSLSTPQSRRKRAGGLTRREMDAAILIADGLSNREVAEAMTVTEKTVEANVTRVLRKLGFDSRVQIATWVVENDIGR